MGTGGWRRAVVGGGWWGGGVVGGGCCGWGWGWGTLLLCKPATHQRSAAHLDIRLSNSYFVLRERERSQNSGVCKFVT